MSKSLSLPDWLRIRASADSSQPTELLIYDEIGTDWFDQSGIGAKAFVDALSQIPRGQEILLRINSPGGNVWDGLAIYNLLKQRRQDVTVRIDGLAASAASFIAMAGREIQMPPHAMLMIHDPIGMAVGNAAVMAKMVKELESNGDLLADIYARRSGQSPKKIREMMRAETWFDGQEAYEFGLVDTLIEEEAIAASFDLSRFRNPPPPKPKHTPRLSMKPSNEAAMERQRISTLQKIWNDYGGREVDPQNAALQHFIDEGSPVSDLQDWLLKNRYKAEPIILDPEIGMSTSEVKRWSLTKALSEMAGGKGLSGLEAEASRAMERKIGRQPDGFYIPTDVTNRSLQASHGLNAGQMATLIAGLQRMNALNAGTASAGGFLVGTEVLGSSMVELLRSRQLVMQLGATLLSNLQGDVAIPKHTGGASVYWLSETGQVTGSQQTFGQLAMTPKRLGAKVAYTKQLIGQASLDVEGFVRNDMMAAMAAEKDRAMLNGAGVLGEPIGIMTTSGIGGVTFGATATRAKALEFQSTLATANVSGGPQAYVTTPAVAAKWMAIAESAAGISWLWQGNIDQGAVAGRPAYSTTQIPSNLVLFGKWDDLIVGDWAGMDIVVDPYTLADRSQIQVTINVMTDHVARRPASFTLSSDSGAQ